MKLLTSLALLISAFVTLPGRATEYHVGPQREIRSIPEVLNRLQPGDTLFLDGNATYPGGISIDRNGTAAKPITLKGVTIDGKRPCISGAKGDPLGSVVRVRGSNVVIENVEITAGDQAKLMRGFYSTGNTVTLRDSVVHDVPAQGLQISDAAGSFTMSGVEVYRCGGGDRAHQVYASSNLARHPDAVFRMERCYLHDAAGGNNVKSRARRTELHSNRIEGAMFHELDLVGADPKAQKLPTGTVIPHDADVRDNLIVKRPGSKGVFAHLGSDGLSSSNGTYRFARNSFVLQFPKNAPAPPLFKIQGTIASLDCDANIVWRAGNGPMNIIARPGKFPSPNLQISGRGNWVTQKSANIPPVWEGTQFLTGDPFKDSAKEDFTLTHDLSAGAKVPARP